MVTYAVESKKELDKQTDATLSKNVKFDAYFDVNEQKTHYKSANLNQEVPELVISVDVQKEGYLKNATIDLTDAKGEKNLNFTITELQDTNAIVQSASENQLVLRQINCENKIEFIAKLSAGVNSAPSIDKLLQDNVLTLKGIYIDKDGEETPIEKDIKINMEWTAKYEAQIKQSLVKYIQLDQLNGNKTLVSVQVEAGLKEEKFILPVQETKTEIIAPIIANERPEQVSVTAISTEATNGQTEESVHFTEENWKYDSENGIVEIKVNNEENVTGKNVDKYIVNYIYSENVYNELEGNEIEIEQNAKLIMNTYTSTGIENAIAEAQEKILLNEEVGKLISLEGINITERIPKGRLYANINNPEGNEGIEYEYKWIVDVPYTEEISGIVIENLQETMTTDSVRKELTDKTIYKQIVFNSNTFNELLGEEGRILIYNTEDILLGIVANDTKKDEKGNYIVELLENVSQIKIQTSKPVKSGNLVINIKKEIKSDLGFAKSEIDNFTNFEVTWSISQIDEILQEKTVVEEKTLTIPLENSVTKSQISINVEKLSTFVKNEDVELNIELGNDNENSDLYVDPIFEIELPECIENVEILESKILFDEELTISKTEFIHKSGIPTIRIVLNGVQTKFNTGVIANGTNIVLKTNIEVNRLTSNSTEEIKMFYYNANAMNYDNMVETDNGLKGLATTNIEFSAPTGMLAIGEMGNYDGEGRTLISVNQGEIIKLVQTYKPSRTMKMRLMAINNTGNSCDNIVLMGRIPVVGSKDVETGEDLGTTIDTYLSTKIVPESLEGEGIKIYYSENVDATTALGDETNGWTLEPVDLGKVKSYMIVLEGYEMPQGQIITFTYDIVVPENIGYNNTINSNFGMYFVNNTQVATVRSFVKSDKIGITTGKGPELQITQTVEGAREGKIDSYKLLKFNINISNVGTEEAKNVTIENQIPKWTTLVRIVDVDGNYEIYQNKNNKATMAEWNVIKNATDEAGSTPILGWTIPSINPGETITKEVYVLTRTSPGIYEYYSNYEGFSATEEGKYYILTNKYDVETDTSYEEKNELTSVPQIELQNITLVSASNINATLKSSSESVDVRDNNIRVEEKCELDADKFVLEGDTLSFGIGVGNMGTTDKTLTIEKVLPEGLKYKSAYIMNLDEETLEEKERTYGKYDATTRKITFENQKIEALKSKSIVILVEVDYLEDIYEKEITTLTKVYEENEELACSDEIKFTIIKPQYTLELKSTNSNSIVNSGDEIEYYLKVTNIGKTLISGINITQVLPEEYVLKEASYVFQGQTINLHKNKEGNIELISMVDVGESLTITIKVKVAKVTEDTDIVVYARASGQTIDLETTEIITQRIEKDATQNSGDNNESGDNSGDSSEETGRTYKIAGMAWLDENENGIREKEEKLLANIMVVAIDETTGEIAKNSETGEDIQASTDSTGKYMLTDLKEGNYLVVFKYDTEIYKTTSYQMLTATELNNSDALEKKILENGEEILAGVTNTLNVNATLSNIDIGLVERTKFDLKLEKMVKQITVQNREGVKVHNYDNTEFAKVEITGKQLKNSTLVIEYIIKITNEGNAAGYAKKIIDYKPSELTFNSDLNTNWYAGNDGNLYMSELEQTLINPGETKEVKLILTKKMNDSSTIMINNRAEIQESISEQGFEDKDSIAGNNAQGEDDIGLADIIITIRTGGAVFYTLITLVILMILAGGIYLIKTKILKEKQEVNK